jgi:hypothetical protein
VTLPLTTQATAELPITVRVSEGGCLRFEKFEVTERTPGLLRLHAISTEPLPESNVACTADARFPEKTYTDPGTVARTNPFEVVVNGRSYGTVKIGSAP